MVKYLSAVELNTDDYSGRYWQLGYFYVERYGLYTPKQRIYVLYKIGDISRERKLFEYDVLLLMMKDHRIDVVNLYINRNNKIVSMREHCLQQEIKFNVIEPQNNGRYTVIGGDLSNYSEIIYEGSNVIKGGRLIVRDNSSGKIRIHNQMECSLMMSESFTNARVTKKEDRMIIVDDNYDDIRLWESGDYEILPDYTNLDQAQIISDMRKYIEEYNIEANGHMKKCKELLESGGLMISSGIISHGYRPYMLNAIIDNHNRLEERLTVQNNVLNCKKEMLQDIHAVEYIRLLNQLDIQKISRYFICVSSGAVFKNTRYTQVYKNKEYSRRNTVQKTERLEKLLNNNDDRQKVLDNFEYMYDCDRAIDFEEEYGRQSEIAKYECDEGLDKLINNSGYTQINYEYLKHRQVGAYLNDKELCKRLIFESLAEYIEGVLDRKIFRSMLRLYGKDLYTFKDVKVLDIVEGYKKYNNIKDETEESNSLAYFASTYCGFCTMEVFKELIDDEEGCLKEILANLVGKYKYIGP